MIVAATTIEKQFRAFKPDGYRTRKTVAIYRIYDVLESQRSILGIRGLHRWRPANTIVPTNSENLRIGDVVPKSASLRPPQFYTCSRPPNAKKRRYHCILCTSGGQPKSRGRCNENPRRRLYQKRNETFTNQGLLRATLRRETEHLLESAIGQGCTPPLSLQGQPILAKFGHPRRTRITQCALTNLDFHRVASD